MSIQLQKRQTNKQKFGNHSQFVHTAVKRHRALEQRYENLTCSKNINYGIHIWVKIFKGVSLKSL